MITFISSLYLKNIGRLSQNMKKELKPLFVFELLVETALIISLFL